MGMRLHIQFAVLLDFTIKNTDEKMKNAREIVMESLQPNRLLDTRYAATENKPFVKLEQDSDTKDNPDVDFRWLDVRHCFTNRNNEFEQFWEAIKPLIVPYSEPNTPVGFWYHDEGEHRLIFINNPLKKFT